jgi:hypothetical protein
MMKKDKKRGRQNGTEAAGGKKNKGKQHTNKKTE